MIKDDPYHLRRFLEAQEQVFNTALMELRNGKKITHWMWFIFPQLSALGHSTTAVFYGISSLDEASAYLQHPMLRDRLEACILVLLNCRVLNPIEIFGYPDHLKFHSSLTLFSIAEPENKVIQEALEKYYHGKPDNETKNILSIQLK